MNSMATQATVQKTPRIACFLTRSSYCAPPTGGNATIDRDPIPRRRISSTHHPWTITTFKPVMIVFPLIS
jgi:hypothetical protein